MTRPPHMAPNPAPLALEMQDVSKRYGRHWALVSVSLKLDQGRSLLLTGHNGSGKTTLMRLAATASSPSTGRIRILGLDSIDEVREKVALLSHASFLYEDLTAEQNLLFQARLLGEPKPRERAAQLLERVGLAKRAQSPVRQFSAGMRKRLAVARLLLKAPRLALLDEPFGELDPAGIQAMEALIRELQAQGCSVVLATHLVEQGESLCDERLHLHEGRRVAA